MDMKHAIDVRRETWPFGHEPLAIGRLLMVARLIHDGGAGRCAQRAATTCCCATSPAACHCGAPVAAPKRQAGESMSARDFAAVDHRCVPGHRFATTHRRPERRIPIAKRINAGTSVAAAHALARTPVPAADRMRDVGRRRPCWWEPNRAER